MSADIIARAPYKTWGTPLTRNSKPFSYKTYRCNNNSLQWVNWHFHTSFFMSPTKDLRIESISSSVMKLDLHTKATSWIEDRHDLNLGDELPINKSFLKTLNAIISQDASYLAFVLGGFWGLW